MTGSFKVAGIQMSCKVGDVKVNVEKGCRMIEEAVKEEVAKALATMGKQPA